MFGVMIVIKMDNEDKGDKVDFTDALMYLLYKKKENYHIKNYRPLALLNTDYKIYTKTIATKLADISHDILHEDQAGFVPKRSIYVLELSSIGSLPN